MSLTTITDGFNAGNYANAYETTDLHAALERDPLCRNNATFRAAFILGFFASYEESEIPDDCRLAYDEALCAVGDTVRNSGLMD